MNLLVIGYSTTNSIIPKPKAMVKRLNCSKIKKEKKSKIAKNDKAFFTEISPEAIGLVLVLLTLRSKLRSKISLITQPAERINIDPIKNNPTIFVKLTEWLNLYARAAPNKQGKNNNQIPIGLFKRERLRYESSINVVLQILHRFLLYLPPQGILS